MRIPWNRWYSLKSYLRSSLWLTPFIALLMEQVMARVTRAIGSWLISSGRIDPKTSYFALSLEGVQVTLDTIITVNMSFLVFTFGSLLVAIQVASGQYTPRIIATTLLRNNAIRCTVGYFVFTMLFALRARNRMGETVDQFTVFVVGAFGLGSVVLFLYLIDYAARALRPVSIVASVAENGIVVIESVYPHAIAGPRSNQVFLRPTSPKRSIAHEGNSGIILAVNLPGLADAASRSNGIIEVAPQVGDFIAVDEPLFLLYGGAYAIEDRTLRTSIALGSERTIEQDPTFAFRILVDIALKALSAAINDPTTAVLAIDQLHRLLRMVGLRHLRDEVIRDEGGRPLVVLRTPNWEDFVHLTFREIRLCGGSIQIARRLRSMGENLMRTLPEYRHPALRAELDLLDRAIERQFVFPEDLALARIPDAQGMGGAAERIYIENDPADGSAPPR